MAEIVTRSTPQVGAQSYVEWGAVFAGAAVALAVSLVLLIVRGRHRPVIGVSVDDHDNRSESRRRRRGILDVACHDLVFCARRLFGGTHAPPLERRSPSEMKFRDSAHGLLVWAVAIIGAAALATAGVSAVGKSLGAAVGSAAAACRPGHRDDRPCFSAQLAQPGRPQRPKREAKLRGLLLRSAGQWRSFGGRPNLSCATRCVSHRALASGCGKARQ